MIYFTSKDSGDTLALGGTATLGGTDKGVVGPFPRYSIAREELATADGTYINSKFTITVTGTATLKSGDSQNMLLKGERQSRVQGEALILSQLNRDTWPMRGNGVLEIRAYAGVPHNVIKFIDARITSLELPEQNATAGVQNQEFTIIFEAYDDKSVASNANSPNGPRHNVTPGNDFALSSVDESWELVPSESKYVFADNDVGLKDSEVSSIVTTDAYRSYILTHTLSATGLKKMSSSGTGLADDGEAWRQAAGYIGKRLAGTKNPALATGILTNTLNMTEDAGSNRFSPGTMDSDDENFKYNLFGESIPNPDYTEDGEEPETLPNDVYKAYNHVRTISSNVSAGSYTVTDTWVLAYGNDTGQSAITDIEVSVEQNAEELVTTTTVSGTVTGLSTSNPESKTNNKYTNAEGAYAILATKFLQLADSAFITVTGGVTIDNPDYPSKDGTEPEFLTNKSDLKNTEISKNVGINKVTGTITFSVTYNNVTTLDEDALTDSITVNDSGGTDVIAIIGVILKANGPVIQDMGTITEQRKSVTYQAKMKKDKRTLTPTVGKNIVNNDYAPFAMTVPNPAFVDIDTTPNISPTIPGPNVDKQFVSNKDESWNQTTGDYTFTKEWLYNTI